MHRFVLVIQLQGRVLCERGNILKRSFSFSIIAS